MNLYSEGKELALNLGFCLAALKKNLIQNPGWKAWVHALLENNSLDKSTIHKLLITGSASKYSLY